MNSGKNKTIKTLLNEGRKKISWSPTPFLDTELILSFILRKNRTYLSANPNLLVSEKIGKKYFDLILRRAKKEPVAYLTGEKEFFGFTFIVNKNVLIPRPETELLVEESIKVIEKGNISSIIDVGTGSGCVILSLARKIYDSNPEYAKKIKWHTTEISEAAIDVAQQNYQKIFPRKELDIKIIKGSILESTSENFDLIISNPPYIGNSEFEKLEENVKKYEPAIALIGGSKGYEFTEKLLQEATEKVNKNGYIILEINSKHAENITKIAKGLFKNCKIKIAKDYSGLDRIIIIKT